jgi:hypothetical protein
MYPKGELDELAERKMLLQARIAVRRWECAAAAVEVARPIAFLDRGIEMWQRVSPIVKFLALPAGLFLTRFIKPRGVRAGVRKTGKIAAFLSALPMIIRVVKMGLQIHSGYQAQKSARTGVPPGPIR